MPRTLPLTPAWDIQLDASGNLALTDAYTSLAQDVASALRTFLGECWYDVSLGMPYLEAILGRRPPVSLVRSKIKQVAAAVTGVGSVAVTAIALANRTITGTLVVTPAGSTQPITVSF